MKIKQINLVILIVFASIILLSMLFLKPARYGDGNEYFLMLESFSNHLSPELQERDIHDFYTGEFNAFGEKINPYSGYFKSKDNKWYSYHFWAYSLSNVLVKLILELFKLDARKSMQITNALLFILSMVIINFFSNFQEKQKLILMLLITFSPALWFIHWSHPEIFIFVLVLLSLIFLNKKKYSAAIIFASIASFQNQAIVLFVLFLLTKAVLSSNYKLKSFLKYGSLSFLIFIPNIFYLMNFGKFSLLSSAVSMKNISVLRIYEMFFDLNIGLFPYIPLSLLLFLGIVFLKNYKKRIFTYESQILLLVIAMMSICSMINNWNSGTSGPTRYVIWMLPFIFFILTMNLDTILKFKTLKYILIAGIFLQFLVVVSYVVFVHREAFVRHSPIAEFVLIKFPALYNPSSEIFCERTMHREDKCDNPTIYIYNKKCRKALLTCNGLKKLQSICNFVDKSIEDYCQQRNNKNNWFYANY